MSQQPEATVGGKTIRWGANEESARTVVLLYDALAAAAILGNGVALSTVAHELTHVSDYFQRAMRFGFPHSSLPPSVNDWPGIRRETADSIWGEFAAESVAVGLMDGEDSEEFRKNDFLHLTGVDRRVRESIWEFKQQRLDLVSLWNSSITNIFDLFTNLGRSVAHFACSSDRVGEAYGPTETASDWIPVIQSLAAELQALQTKPYAEWPDAPFTGIEALVERGYQTLGISPLCDGDELRIQVL